MKSSTLKLAHVIMSTDGRFWLDSNQWGHPEGNDLYDAMLYTSKRKANNERTKIEPTASIFDIGIYNGKPVMLIDAYTYYMDAKYTPKATSA